jgi:hypothetical protein
MVRECGCTFMQGTRGEAGSEAEAERQEQGALPVGEEAKVADAHKSAWEQVQ